MTVQIDIAPLTPEAFAPYGEVIAHYGDERRHKIPLQLGPNGETLTVTSWVNRILTAIDSADTSVLLERHPFTDQLFVPISGQRYLVIVADGEDDAPDLTTIKGFVATPHQGVLYRRNTWHAGMKVLDAPAHFFVLMGRREDGGDDVFLPQETAVTLNFSKDLSLSEGLALAEGIPA